MSDRYSALYDRRRRRERRHRRTVDPAAQPERTSLAWFRTLLSCCVLALLVLRHQWSRLPLVIWLTLAVVTLVIVMIYVHARRRNLMDIALADFSRQPSVRAKLLMTLAIFALAMIFAITHAGHLLSGVAG